MTVKKPGIPYKGAFARILMFLMVQVFSQRGIVMALKLGFRIDGLGMKVECRVEVFMVFIRFIKYDLRGL